MKTLIRKFDSIFIPAMAAHGVMLLRIALGIVFFWFGALKVLGVSPVGELVAHTYGFLPAQPFLMFLGVWEIAIGIGLIFKIALRLSLGLLWLQMAGTFLAPALSPTIFFNHHNFFLLTTEGEFVIKNLVLVTAGIVIGGREVEPRSS